MAKLPRADDAIIEERKITDYLLNKGHRFGGPKAVFFERFGFTATDWHILRDALLVHANEHEVNRSYPDNYVQVYEVIGSLVTPDGRNPTILVAWMIRYGEDQPRLVTAIPS